jgi:hypothetical protein
MHDSDSKAIISSADGKLIYSDFVKFKPIQQLVIYIKLRTLNNCLMISVLNLKGLNLEITIV